MSAANLPMDKLRIFVDFVPSPDLVDMLRAGTRGHELIFSTRPTPSVLAKAEPDAQLATAEIAFGQPDLGAIASAPRLKWIHISSSGITRYDTPEARASLTQRGIALSNSASVYNEACATHALSFILAQARQLPRALQSRALGGSDDWTALRNASVPLVGQTAVILGFGAIGKRLAEMLQPFAMKIFAYRRKVRGDEGVPVLAAEELARVLAHEADHVIDILPDSIATRNFFNHERLATIKPGAVFYNIGRGSTVEQDSLGEALRSGRLAAAWLDVTDPEPLPDDHPLRRLPNCFITPHVAGGHVDETKTLVEHFLRNFERFTRGKPLLDRVL